MTITTTLRNIFTSPTNQLRRFREINEQFSLGFDEEDFDGLGTTPETHPGGLKAWTLEVMLKTPEETLLFIVRNLIRTDWHGRVAGLRKGTIWVTCGLRWVLVDFGCHVNEVPRTVLDRKVAHIGVFWQAVYSPQWVACMGYDGGDPSQTIEDVYVPQVLAAGLTLDYQGVDGSPRLGNGKIGQQSIEWTHPGNMSVAKYVEIR